jgi:hypothetical protein
MENILLCAPLLDQLCKRENQVDTHGIILPQPTCLTPDTALVQV